MWRLLLLCCVAPIAWSDPVRVAIGEHKPPYIDEQRHTGLEPELLRAAFARAGLEVLFVNAPNKRAAIMLEQGRVDAALDAGTGLVSDPYIQYRNMAITLCAKDVKLGSLPDLSRYSVGAFQNAARFLGQDYAQAVSASHNYREFAPQVILNRMLTAGRIDIAVADINIFRYLQTGVDPTGTKTLCPYALFEPSRYRLRFRDARLRDLFNTGLRQTRADGVYEQLGIRLGLSPAGTTPYFKP
ncbi:substrate-binding periplasmic protein [Chitinibacteraceae bacterium HSL-7]